MKKQVFISYAHADDARFDEEVSGWVTAFVDNLVKVARMQPGGESLEIWMDHSLEPQVRVDRELRRRIRNSDILVIFMSPRYLISRWCLLELRLFLRTHRTRGTSGRIFLVETLPTERSSWHRSLRGLNSIPFWTKSLEKPEPKRYGWPAPNPKRDYEYWDSINRLGTVVARQLVVLPAVAPILRGSLGSMKWPAVPTTPAPVTAAAPATPSEVPAVLTTVPEGPLSILINADSGDQPIALDAQLALSDLDVDAYIAAEPTPTQLPADYRTKFEGKLRDSHGVIVVYGGAPPTWVQAKYGDVRKVLAMERKGTWAGLLEGPPDAKAAHGLPPRNLMVLDCKKGIDKAELARFVAALKAAAASAGRTA